MNREQSIQQEDLQELIDVTFPGIKLSELDNLDKKWMAWLCVSEDRLWCVLDGSGTFEFEYDDKGREDLDVTYEGVKLKEFSKEQLMLLACNIKNQNSINE